MRSILLAISLLAACSGPETQADRANASSVAPRVEAPADAAAGNVQAVIGATPGPCGSTRAERFLGQIYRSEMDASLRRATGATALRIIGPQGEGGEADAIVDRRLNVYLNNSRQIIMFDCG